MQIDNLNIHKLQPAQTLYGYTNNGVVKWEYLGNVPKSGTDRYFFVSQLSKEYYVYFTRYHFTQELFTNYQEAAESFRLRVCGLIDHFNKHDLKDNPIHTERGN